MSKYKPRLGRGLSSLISVSESPDELIAAPSLLATTAINGVEGAADFQAGTRVVDVPLDQVKSNPHQPRRDFNDASLHELAASLKTNGLIQPIVVRAIAGGFELIAGERRLRAAKLVGFATLPAIVRELDGLTQAQLALVENIQREDLNAIDRAQAYKVLLEQLGLSHAELATRLGEDRSSISNHLRLLELAVPVRELLRGGTLSTGHAKVLAGVADLLEQERLANVVVAQGLSVRNLERLAAAAPMKAKPRGTGSAAHIKNLEKNIARQLGMRVDVRSKQNGSGKLIIHYASLDHFDELMGKLAVQVTEDE